MPSTTNDVVLYTGEASPNDVRLRHSTFMYAACVGVCSTSAYLKTGDIEVFQVALNTVTGAQDLTYKGFGTPVGALVILTNTTVNGAKANHAIIGFGATDGTRFFSCCSHIKNNVATTLSGRRGTETRFLTLVDQDNGNLVLADFTSWVTDGLRITINTAPPAGYIMTVVLFGGAGVTNFHTDVVVTPSVIDTATTVNVGFAPDGLIVVHTGIGWTDGNSTNGGFGLGFAQKTGSEPPAQFSNAHFDVNAVGTSSILESYYTTYAARDANNSAWAVEVKNFTATGYDAYTRLFASAFTVGVIAFKLSGLRAKVLGLTTPASLGAHDDVGIGFLSQFAMLSLGSNDTDNARQTDQEAEVIGVGAITSNVQSCHAITNQDAVSPTVAESVVSLNPISMRRQGALLAEASFTSFSADTLSTNYTTVNSTRKIAALFIEQQPTGGASFAAAAFCICSTSAALSTSITMAAATSCICSTNLPALTTAITMLASCSGVCSTSAALTTQITMAASCSGVCSTVRACLTATFDDQATSGHCSTSAALTTAITMLASASCICATSAALTTAITLAASATCLCSTSASLTTAITMASASSCVCSTSASLTTAITCKATTSCVCSTSAALTTQITMAASCSGVCSTSCGLTTAIRCLASATCVCSTSASLTTQITMAAAATGVCSTSCGLTTAITCACSATGVCSTSAALTTKITMAASATGVCSTSASLTAGSGIFAGATCVCSTSAALSTAITCLSSSSGICATSAALTTAITMLGAASVFCSTSGSCSTAIQCAVAATGKCATSASLSTAILCAAVTSGHVGCQANLMTAIRLACAATGQCGTAGKLAELFQTKATGVCATSAALRVPFAPSIVVLSATRAYTIPCTTRPLVVDAEARDYLVTAGGPDG